MQVQSLAEGSRGKNQAGCQLRWARYLVRLTSLRMSCSMRLLDSVSLRLLKPHRFVRFRELEVPGLRRIPILLGVEPVVQYKPAVAIDVEWLPYFRLATL